MALTTGDKVKVKSESAKEPSHADASGTVIKLQYCIQFPDKSACWYNENDLVPSPAPVVKPAPAPAKPVAPPVAQVAQPAASVAPSTDAGDKKE